MQGEDDFSKEIKYDRRGGMTIKRQIIKREKGKRKRKKGECGGRNKREGGADQ
jgi:hypothetical protein